MNTRPNQCETDSEKGIIEAVETFVDENKNRRRTKWSVWHKWWKNIAAAYQIVVNSERKHYYQNKGVELVTYFVETNSEIEVGIKPLK